MTEAVAISPARALFGPATWYAWLLNAFTVYFVNLQGNIIPFMQDEFDLDYRTVSLHSSAIAVGVVFAGLLGDRVIGRLGRSRALKVGTLLVVAGATLLCLLPGPPWSIASCVLIGASFNQAVVPALLADLHGPNRAKAYAGQSIVAYGFGIAAPLLTGLFVWLGLGWRAPLAFGAMAAVAVLAVFYRLAIPNGARPAASAPRRLSAAFWSYWAVAATTGALEFSVLLWAPAYLERIAGFTPAIAASVAAVFAAGVLAGRIGLGVIVGRVSGQRLLVIALLTALVGFLFYWGIGGKAGATVGILLLGLGVAPLYPLTMSFAVGVAGSATDLAGARMMLAFGASLLLAPIALGALADAVGLAMAQLALPVLIAASLGAFGLAVYFQRRQGHPQD